PVMLLYVDHSGGDFFPAERGLIDELCQSTSKTLATILELRRAARRSAPPPPPARPAKQATPVVSVPPARSTPPDEQAAAVVSARPAPPTPSDEQAAAVVSARQAPPAPPNDQAAPAASTRAAAPAPPETKGRPTATPAPSDASIGPPPEYGTSRAASWGAPPPRLREALESEGADKSTVPRLPSDRPKLPRDTQIDGSPPSTRPEEEPRRALTITAMPPPPPIPPPPPMGGDERKIHDTIVGLPEEESAEHPRFIPPPLDERENAGIISLASPIHQGSVRGRIAVEDDDWAPPHHPASDSL